jgi:formate C-acetyltransferase
MMMPGKMALNRERCYRVYAILLICFIAELESSDQFEDLKTDGGNRGRAKSCLTNLEKELLPGSYLEMKHIDRDVNGSTLDETILSLRHKDVRSTTLERIRLTREADDRVEGLAQPLQLGEGLSFLLDNISLPVSPGDLLLGRISEEVPDADGEAFFQNTTGQWNGRGIPPWMQDGGHECFAWDRLLGFGLPGLEGLAQRELERRARTGEAEDQLDFLRGAVLVYQAFRNYARRYASAARRVGMGSLAANCEAIADGPPQSFAEAMQLLWLVGLVYCTMAAVNPTLTFGRLDELLVGFYRRDVACGCLSRQDAGNLIEDFYCKNNIIIGRGEHQMSGGSEKATGWARNLTYDAPQYIVLGGRRQDDSDPANELTELFLERIVPRFENPVVVLRYTSDLPETVWRLACEKMRANASFMVYSDENIIPAMVRCGIEEGEAVTYTMHGCNWPDIPGIQRQQARVSAQLPRYIIESLQSDSGSITNIDDVYERVASIFRKELGQACKQFRNERSTWEQHSPGPLRVDDCFLDGPIERARSWRFGGVKYNTLTCAIWSPATAADCLTALDELVFKSKRVPLETLTQALGDDFADQESLRKLCLNAPKFGQDDDCADRHAVRLLHTILGEIDCASRKGSEDEVVVFRCLETDMSHIPFGKSVGATPDGRHAGHPTSENTSPYPGSALNGITAMLNSVAKLPLDRINSGALNVRIQPGLFAGEAGLSRLTALLRTYFDMGGLQIQLSFVDVEQLRDAQAHPENHRDLMVRITGYSAAFVDMAKHAQDEIIRREEMGN